MTMTIQDVRKFFDSHWTVRRYKEVPMPDDHLDVILHAAQRAPTDATAQMYTFIRLTSLQVRQQIATLAGNPHIATASESFVVCADVNRLRNILKHRDFEPGQFPRIAVHFGIGDAVLAGENMLLAAEMLGYRGCWIGGVMNALEDISVALNLPAYVLPFSALTIGVPDEAPVYRPRLPREQVVFENSYRDIPAEELSRGIDAMAGITARGDWAQTLARYFGAGGSMEERDRALEQFLLKRFGFAGENVV